MRRRRRPELPKMDGIPVSLLQQWMGGARKGRGNNIHRLCSDSSRVSIDSIAATVARREMQMVLLQGRVDGRFSQVRDLVDKHPRIRCCGSGCRLRARSPASGARGPSCTRGPRAAHVGQSRHASQLHLLRSKLAASQNPWRHGPLCSRAARQPRPDATACHADSQVCLPRRPNVQPAQCVARTRWRRHIMSQMQEGPPMSSASASNAAHSFDIRPRLERDVAQGVVGPCAAARRQQQQQQQQQQPCTLLVRRCGRWSGRVCSSCTRIPKLSRAFGFLFLAPFYRQ